MKYTVIALSIVLISATSLMLDAASAPKYELVFADKTTDKFALWKYFGGDEFPGAKGSLTLDKRVRKRGSASMRLDGDFSGGGAYVAIVTSFKNLKQDANGIVFYARAQNIQELSLRLTDSSGQTHQIPRFQVSDKKWTLHRFSFKELEKKHESWGGKADGTFVPPLKGMSFVIGGKRASNTKNKKMSLWIDDVALDVSKK